MRTQGQVGGSLLVVQAHTRTLGTSQWVCMLGTVLLGAPVSEPLLIHSQDLQKAPHVTHSENQVGPHEREHVCADPSLSPQEAVLRAACRGCCPPPLERNRPGGGHLPPAPAEAAQAQGERQGQQARGRSDRTLRSRGGRVGVAAPPGRALPDAED